MKNAEDYFKVPDVPVSTQTSREFALSLLDYVYSYKTDVFVTYDQLNKMSPGDYAVVGTRRSGCEFITTKAEFYSWKGQLNSIWLVMRCVVPGPLCAEDSVMVVHASPDEAEDFLMLFPSN